MINFHWRKSMDMHIREFILNILKNIAVIKDIPIRKKPSLDTYLGSIYFCSCSCLFKNFRYRHDISLLFLECAEFACTDAHICKIYVPVNDIGNSISGGLFSKPVSKGK